MARLKGVEDKPPLIARVAFLLARRSLGRVPRPLRIRALAPHLVAGFGQMERAEAKSRSVPPSLVKLAQVRVATRVGCPF